jgi:hypothetical protein
MPNPQNTVQVTARRGAGATHLDAYEPIPGTAFWEPEVAGSNPVVGRASAGAYKQAIQQFEIQSTIFAGAVKVPKIAAYF